MLSSGWLPFGSVGQGQAKENSMSTRVGLWVDQVEEMTDRQIAAKVRKRFA